MEGKRNGELVSRARELRRDMTKEERRLWFDYLRTYPVRFSRQKVLGRYIADFYCAQAGLVLELDGSQHYEPEEQEAQCRCVAHPLEKHPTRRNLFTDYVADMTVLFSCYKAEDDWEDEHSLKGLVYSYLLGRKFRKKPLLYQEKVRNISLAMQDFADAEKQGNADIDTMAGLFGRVMAQIVSCREDEWKDNLERLGFFLGKFIYLLDAYEDIEQDLKKGTYNPLKKRYEEPGFEEECRQILTMMMSECCKEFEQLPILQNVDILRNILYSGVWCRYEIVREKREKDSVNEVTGNDL